MRAMTAVTIGLLIGAARPCAAETLTPESRITAVTVFPDRATVTRRARVKLDDGTHVVRLGPLPAGIEPNSVTARGAGEADVVLYGVRLATEQLEAAQDPTVKAREDKIRDAGRAQQRLRGTKQILEQERRYLASIQAASAEQIGKDLITKSPSAADAAALLAFLDEALLKTMARDQDADAQLLALNDELDRLRRELAQLHQNRARQTAFLDVDLEARDGGAFELEVSYRVMGATWAPAYEARATTGAEEVVLGAAGIVRQQTGEPWEDVVLTLSTARPAVAGSMPELQPWFLRPWQPPVMPLAEEAEVSAPAAERRLVKQAGLMDHFAASSDEAWREADVAVAAVDAQGPSVTYRLPKPASIPSDWQPHKVPVGLHTLKASFAYETTPRLAALAFLRAKVDNSTGSFFLSGPVAVFLDGGFVATAALEQVAPGETFDLYLGADERIKVERLTLKEHVEVSLLPGLRGKTKSTDYEFLTTVENFTGRRISLVAFDQLPVSEREEIIVESVKLTPAKVEKDAEKPGVFQWTLDLNPSQKEELRVSYRVRHPVDMEVR
jgi:uncharacterized protein (TIGR02231 family)